MQHEGEQKLVDLCFEIGIALQMNQKWLKTQSRDQVAQWVRNALYSTGYPTTPIGSCWGIITTEEEHKKYDEMVRDNEKKLDN